MKQTFIPLDKRTKREQREHYAAQRGGWGSVNPVTRRVPNAKAYSRKGKSAHRFEVELGADFFLFCSVFWCSCSL